MLLVGGLAACLPLRPLVAGILAGYFALMIAYTVKLKTIVLLDTLILAAGYGLRVVAGAVAVDNHPSPELFGFCTFLFLSLALVKRYTELVLLRVHDGRPAQARGYRLEDQEVILVLGSGSGILSVLMLTQYMGSSALGGSVGHSAFALATSVLLLYWISHMWLTAHRGRMSDDPLVFAISDRVSQVLIALLGTAAWLAA